MIYFANLFFPERASTIAGLVDGMYGVLVAITIVFSVLIAFMIILFSALYYRKSPDEKPKPIEGNELLEAIWIGLPLVIVMGIFFLGTLVYFKTVRMPEGGIHIYGIGKQWMWKFQHSQGKREINDLHVPINTPVKVTLTSEDVIHSFYVPAFRVKNDAVPGKYTAVWFEATKPGAYHLFCAEYCGTEHSRMIGTVYAMQPEDYQAWLQGGTGTPVTMEAAGEKLFNELRCNSCHSSEPTALGPSLNGVYGNQVTTQDGEAIVADESYLRESILFPTKRIVKGYQPVMPTYKTQINEDQLLQIISYVKSLGGGQEGNAS